MDEGLNTEEKEQQFRQPLLDDASPQNESDNDAFSDSSTMGKGDDIERSRRGAAEVRVDSLEQEASEIEHKSSHDLIGAAEVRYLWILFQIVWPAFWWAFDADLDGRFLVLVIVPALFVSWILSLVSIQGRSLFRDECRGVRDVLPTIFWCLAAVVPSNSLAEDAAETLFFIFAFAVGVLLVLGFLLAVIMSFRHGLTKGTNAVSGFCLYYVVRFPIRRCPNYFQHLEDRDWERREAQRVSQQEKLDAQIESLSYLETVAQKRRAAGTTKEWIPTWIVYALFALAVVSLACVVYLYQMYLSEVMKTYKASQYRCITSGTRSMPAASHQD